MNFSTIFNYVVWFTFGLNGISQIIQLYVIYSGMNDFQIVNDMNVA
jgi:ABC-type arginine/histidine transport system permease subunit